MKLAIEKYLLLYQRLHGLQPVILRVANPYGERQRVETAQGAVMVFLHRTLRNEEIEIWGDGEVVRDYLYIGDVAAAFSAAVTYDGSSTVFNISSGRGVSLNELLESIETVTGITPRRTYRPARPFDVPSNILSNRLAERELGWKPEIDLHLGIEMTSRWISENL